MYCIKCGKEISDNVNFCPSCGAKVEVVLKAEEVVVESVEEEVVETVVASQPVSTEPHVAGVWKTFAKLAKVFGIVSISTCWIPVFGLMMLTLSMPGIAFGALGMSKGKASKAVKSSGTIGMILSIIATVLAFVFYVLFIVLIVGLA